MLTALRLATLAGAAAVAAQLEPDEVREPNTLITFLHLRLSKVSLKSCKAMALTVAKVGSKFEVYGFCVWRRFFRDDRDYGWLADKHLFPSGQIC